MPQNESEIIMLKVGTATDATRLANCIVTNYIKDPECRLTLRAIGASPINQAVKAAIIANKYFSKRGLVVSLVPSFNDLDQPTPEGTGKVTAVELNVKLFRP